MMTPPCHLTCEHPLNEKGIGRGWVGKDPKELLRRGGNGSQDTIIVLRITFGELVVKLPQ